MKLLEIDQNTQDWLEQRKKVIGASDAPAIMCVSPWRTPLMLWEEKLGICTPDQASKAYIFWKGHKMESIARQFRELQIGFDIPAQVVQGKSFSWSRVSLDCLNINKSYVGEIKFMGAADWILLKEKGIVPEHYKPQVQYQLYVTGLPQLEFIGINESKKLARTIVLPDYAYMKKMVQWCEYFWNLVQTKKAPKLMQQDYKFLMRKKAVTGCKRIFAIDKKIKALFEERDLIQDEVLSIAKSTRMVFKRKKVIRIGDFDHDDLGLIIDLEGHDLSHLGRSIKDNLKLLIISNNHKHIKGASNVSKKSKSKKVKRKSKAKRRESKSKPSIKD